MNYRPLFEKFVEKYGLIACTNEPLNRHCTWRIGGPADFLVEPSSWEQLGSVMQYAHGNGIPAIVIGKGSNLLFDDAGLRGIVIKIGRKLSRLSMSGTTVQAESGISASRLARVVGLAGLCGLEHIVGIPGTLGGLVAMNGGSQRRSISEVIKWVKFIAKEGNLVTYNRDQCQFGYRHSIFQEISAVIVEVALTLVRRDRTMIRREMLDVLRTRRKKFPLRLPNCGSIFKSSPEIYATVGPPGKVIEELGLKGLRLGDAEVSRKHANFIVNAGNAKASDVLELIHQVRAIVYEKMEIWMECEVRFVHPGGRIVPGHQVLSSRGQHRSY